MANRVRRTIVQRKNDPYIYLFVAGEWYCYNPEESPLGSGAMGDVYRGYRCKTGEMVAVKRVKDYYANNQYDKGKGETGGFTCFPASQSCRNGGLL